MLELLKRRLHDTLLTFRTSQFEDKQTIESTSSGTDASRSGVPEGPLVSGSLTGCRADPHRSGSPEAPGPRLMVGASEEVGVGLGKATVFLGVGREAADQLATPFVLLSPRSSLLGHRQTTGDGAAVSAHKDH